MFEQFQLYEGDSIKFITQQFDIAISSTWLRGNAASAGLLNATDLSEN